ncbi:unnamed protein product [Protopolystoma xenopodis]|uniref:Uncharacterized protein n=1 Tax=Protopolystoma xenopodis TaxID=117903 RepID=A0A448XFT3_9PLAT|nr:unnamed protein product [Protopolystoma xenopodis]
MNRVFISAETNTVFLGHLTLQVASHDDHVLKAKSAPSYVGNRYQTSIHSTLYQKLSLVWLRLRLRSGVICTPIGVGPQTTTFPLDGTTSAPTDFKARHTRLEFAVGRLKQHYLGSLDMVTRCREIRPSLHFITC